MKVQAAALAAGLLAGAAHADSDAATAIDRPSFTPTSVKGEFVEQFTDDWELRWKPSHAKKDMKGSNKDDEEWAYVGQWSVEEPSVFPGIEGDKGLVLKNAAAHHAISTQFSKAIDPARKPLVVQYEVKLQNGLECGGAYIKLLRDNAALHQDEFANTTPYVIMFGPDKCGNTNKVHFIFNHKNPKTGEYEEKHLQSPPSAKIVKTTELYTLIVQPDNTFVIKQNGEEVKSGSLLEDFSPAVMPEAEIDDAEDSKPADWIDEARIADPEATKPEDWDEAAPFEIVDDSAEMPEDWLENEPLQIPDPDAEKPEDWDDDEDGDFVPSMVANPKCNDAAGCGPWKKPMMKNPLYKGKWSAPQIDNPAYKGVWAPRKVPNPDYFEDKTPANFEPIGGIGFEIWTMQKDILFDNIYVGHSVEEAEKLAAETFSIKHPIEKAVEALSKPKDSAKPKQSSGAGLSFSEDPLHYIQDKVELFLTIARSDPIEAVKFVPEVAAGLAAFVMTVLAILGTVFMGSSGVPTVSPQTEAKVKRAAKDAKAKAVEVKDMVVDAAASGVEGVKGEVNKRTATTVE